MVVVLQEVRKKRHMTQQELSQRSGVTQQAISKIETGVTLSPGADVLYKLARALRCTVDDLIRDEEEEKQ